MTAAREGRLFVGLPLGPELGAELGLLAERTLGRDAFRLARPAGLHLTLYFLGKLEPEPLLAFAEALHGALVGLPAPVLRLRSSGAFPSPARARVLWVGVEERAHTGRLAACHRAVLEAARQAGIDTRAEERHPFEPHVTTARPRASRAPVPRAFRELAAGLDWDPETIALFESRPAPGGSLYVALESWPLATGG